MSQEIIHQKGTYIPELQVQPNYKHFSGSVEEIPAKW